MSGGPPWQQPPPGPWQQPGQPQPPPGSWQQPGPQQQWPQQPPYGWQQPGGPPHFGQPPRRSRAPIIAGVVVVAVLIVIAIGGLAFLASTLGPLLSRTALQDLTVGQCFNGGRAAPTQSGGSLVFGVDVVPCTEPHTSELAATFDHPVSGPSPAFPGTDTVARYAEVECLQRFADYVGLSFSLSVFGMTYVHPTEANWDEGDYSIQCVVHPPDGQDRISESIRNARR